MTTKERAKAVLDCLAGGRGIAEDSLTVGYPEGVKRHRMTSLKAKPILPAKESRAARRPGKENLVKSNGKRKVEDLLKFCPYRPSERTVISKMSEILWCRTVVAEKTFGGPAEDASAEREGADKEFVPGGLMRWKDR
jgi:hypothetical protein